MAATTDAGKFFQTDDSLAQQDRKQRKAANTQGQPVKFPSKLLAVGIDNGIDPNGDTVFVAEAGGVVTGLRLSDNQLSTLLSGPTAPVTSLAFCPLTSGLVANTHLILAGSWDKSIYQYTVQTPGATSQASNVVNKRSFKAHSDFVKCVLVAPTADGQLIIISGGADGEVRLWTLEGKSLAVIKPQCRGIECLVLDPASSPDAPTVFFSTSQREIFSFVIPTLDSIRPSQIQLSIPVVVHETSVYNLHFDADGDLWTASADKTAKHLVRELGWRADSTLLHPDFVRDVVAHDRYGWVVTACRDEDVRVWNKATGSIHHVFTGHYEEVTGLALIRDLVISVSIDATLRRWSLAPVDLKAAVEEARNPRLAIDNPEPTTDLGMLTAEEEAELQAMMADEEADTLEQMAMDEQ